MIKLRNIIVLLILMGMAGCSGGSGLSASVILRDQESDASSSEQLTIKPYQVIWMANSKLTSEENAGGGFTEASFATNGTDGKFIFAIRANLPQPQENSFYKAWLLENDPLRHEMLDLGALTNDSGISYSLTYEENFAIDETIDNPHRYSTYLQAMITQEPAGTEMLKGDLKVIRSVSLDSPLRGSVVE